ncbi:MAG TPA: helix-turn-helix transcriptional regulator [Candidatus Aquilonibacter sp.]|nr:helix-turn-helix transcriptional regulator [Candidatus Aquilonibacter sp.]
MKVSHKAVAELIASIYEAAVDSRAWELFLRQLTTLVDGGHAALLLLDHERAHLNVAVSSGVNPEALRVYQEYYSQTDEWARRSEKLVHAGWVGTGQMICPDEILIRTEFYSDFLAKFDMFHEFAGIVEKRRSSTAAITVVRPRRAGPFHDDAIRFTKLLMPHMQRAVKLHARVAELRWRTARTESALDSVPAGIVFVDGHGAVLQMNRSAETLFRRKDGLLLTKSGVRATSFREDEHLQCLVREAARMTPVPSSRISDSLLVSRTRSKCPLSVFVAPVRSAFASAPPGACVVIFVTDPDAKLQPPLKMLESLYHLTPAEARLAILLLNGVSLTQASEMNGTSRNTTRTHAQHLFQKLGVRRQGELVSLLLRTLGPLS